MNVFAKFPVAPSAKPIFNNFLDDVFARSVADFVGSDGISDRPAVNIVENQNAYTLQVAAPGFEKENFNIKINGDQLSITGEKAKKPDPEQVSRYTRREFHYEKFERSFTLPKTVNQNAIGAVYENGILLVTLPKTEETKPTAKIIEVN